MPEPTSDWTWAAVRTLSPQPDVAADSIAIWNLVALSHQLVDTGDTDVLANEVFAAETDAVVPVAEFGFTSWRGTDEIRAGYRVAMQRFEAAVHAVSNVHVAVDPSRRTATARYYVQGWHWVATDQEHAGPRNADFLLLGMMTDELVEQAGRWRIRRRQLTKLGPDVASGALPEFLTGLGQ